MVYRDFHELKLSGLGMGNMRLPVIDGDDGRINYPEAERVIRRAYEGGINYFDTAWGYHKGTSEDAVGRALSAYPRESYFLADKFPGYGPENFTKISEIFSEQLRRCRVEYFDFYLCHTVTESNIGNYTDPKFGLKEFLMEQKAAGRIRYLGFSCHGDLPVFEQFLQFYGDMIDFCQIQLNYVDWTLQNAKAKVELLRGRGIPIWVMEPVRGGRLVHLPGSAAAELAALRPEESVPAWAFRFLQSLPGVTMVLSGMSSVQQVDENLATWSELRPLSGAEFDAVTDIGRRLFTSGMLTCTACRYCASRCPQGLDIPRLISLYNECLYTGSTGGAAAELAKLPEGKRPEDCVACRSCEEVCPQKLSIPDTFKKFSEMLEK